MDSALVSKPFDVDLQELVEDRLLRESDLDHLIPEHKHTIRHVGELKRFRKAEDLIDEIGRTLSTS